MLTLDLSKLSTFLPADYIPSREQALSAAHAMLQEGNGPGGDFTGWVKLPANYDKTEFERVKGAAKKIQADSQVLVVIGIGGSYLGARAVIELLCSNNYNLKAKNTPDILFVGNSLSTDAMLETMSLIGERDFSINVISKSGTTTEPAVAFRIFKGLLEAKYGKQAASKRIYATTDKARGALKGLADAEGYETFVVPDDIGGRYSVLTAVGLLPIAVAGIDIDALMSGAGAAMEALSAPGLDNGDTVRYVTLDELFAEMTSLYRLDQIAAADGKITLGELPTGAKAQLWTLGLTWVCIGIYVVCDEIKKKKLLKKSKNH